jgi:uncharacterized membrane protein
MIEEVFQEIAGGVALALEALVVVIIAAAAMRAFIRTLPLLLNDEVLAEKRYDIWLRFGTAILLALEFTLAADIIRSAVSPSWDAIGKLGAIAAIRIALNFFLARDIENLAEAKRGAHEDRVKAESAKAKSD